MNATQCGEPLGSPLHVLHVCSIKGRGGTGYMAGHICRLLYEHGHYVAVAACIDSKMEERARESGIPLLSGLSLRRGFHPLDLWRDVSVIRRFIIENNIQIVHAWHSIEYWTCALAVRGTGAKLVRTRGLVTPIKPHFFNRFLHNRTAALFATCKKIINTYTEAGFSAENIFSLVDGVDTLRFNPEVDGSVLRRELGIPEGAMVVVNIGRTEPIKGQDTLLEAMAMLGGEAHLLVAGGGSLLESLRAKSIELGIGERAHFLGVRSDVEKVLAAGDIYVLCSTGSEGSSRATLEAMACGLPCITTTVGMLPDIVRPGLTGLLYSPKDSGQLAECLGNLLNDSGMRRRLGEKALAMVRWEYSEAVMIDNIENVYRRILD